MWVPRRMTCSKAAPANTCGGLLLSEHRKQAAIQCAPHSRAHSEIGAALRTKTPRASRPMAAGAANAWRSGWQGTVRGDMGLGCKRNACLIAILAL